MTPLGHKLLVLPIKEEKTATGLIIPEASQKQNKGKVIVVGTKVNYIKQGEEVIYHDHCGITIHYNGVDHLMLKCGERDSEIIAVL